MTTKPTTFVTVIIPSMRLTYPFVETLVDLHPDAKLEFFKLVPIEDEEIPDLIDKGINIGYKASNFDSRPFSRRFGYG